MHVVTVLYQVSSSQVGPSHFAFLLSDGRICRLPFSVISDRLDLSRTNSSTSTASTIPLASAAASGSGAAAGTSGGGGGGSASSKSAYKTPQASTAAASGTSERYVFFLALHAYEAPVSVSV